MGCSSSSSTAVPDNSDAAGVPSMMCPVYHPRETRIIQVEEVDTWKNLSKETKTENVSQKEGFHKYRVEVQGEWRRGLSAGGSRNDLEMFARNPQYLLTVGFITNQSLETDFPSCVLDTEHFPDPRRSQYHIPVFISLKQINTEQPLHIAFFVYKAEEAVGRLDAEYFLCVSPVASSGVYVNSSVIEHKCSLLPGLYILVSAVFLPHHSGSFLLGVNSDRPITLQPLQNSFR